MGRATAEQLVALGAEVHGLDIRPCPIELADFHACDLARSDEIDSVVDDFDAGFDALFNCAGLPNSFPPVDIVKVNFIGMRHLTERVLPLLNPGASIATVASTAGFGYTQRIPTLVEFVSTPDYAAAVAWCEAHRDDLREGYGFSKEAVIVWTMFCSNALIKRNIRINCTSPGPTSTPMYAEFEKASGKEFMDAYPRPIGRNATPEEQAHALIFLNDGAAASYITGHNLVVDGGWVAGMTMGQIDMTELMKLFAGSRGD